MLIQAIYTQLQHRIIFCEFLKMVDCSTPVGQCFFKNASMKPWLSSCADHTCRLTIKASCPMSLRRFPIDVQTCSLMFSSCRSAIVQLEIGVKEPLFLVQMPTEHVIWFMIGSWMNTMEWNSNVWNYLNSIYFITKFLNMKFEWMIVKLHSPSLLSVFFSLSSLCPREPFCTSTWPSHSSKCRLLSFTRLHSSCFTSYSVLDFVLDR